MVVLLTALFQGLPKQRLVQEVNLLLQTLDVRDLAQALHSSAFLNVIWAIGAVSGVSYRAEQAS